MPSLPTHTSMKSKGHQVDFPLKSLLCGDGAGIQNARLGGCRVRMPKISERLCSWGAPQLPTHGPNVTVSVTQIVKCHGISDTFDCDEAIARRNAW